MEVTNILLSINISTISSMAPHPIYKWNTSLHCIALITHTHCIYNSMANNVFGIPVTDDTVKHVYQNKTPPFTARDRAQVALLYMNAEGKAKNVSKFVHNLKKDYGDGTSTLCMIYNATGGDLTFVVGQNWDGHVWKSPSPQLIQNGQWAGFLHVRDIVWGPSKGAVVYRGTNNDGFSHDWVLAWNTPMMNFDNHVYTEIRAISAPPVNWNAISNDMEEQGFNLSITGLGCFSSVAIGSGSSPEFVGTMSLDGLDAKSMAMASDVSTISQSLDSKYVDVVEGKEGGATPAAAE